MIDLNILQLRLDSNMTEVVRSLGIKKGRALVVLQKYNLCEGTDVAVWLEPKPGTFQRTVYATGAASLGIDIALMDKIDFTEFDHLPPGERISCALEKAYADGTIVFDDWIEEFASSNEPFIQETVEVPAAEYRRVWDLINRLGDGCRSTLGAGTAVRCAVLNEGNVEAESRSWGGSIDPEMFWSNVNQILDIARINDLDHREYHPQNS